MASASTTSPTHAVEPKGNRKRVLVAEDDEAIRTMLVKALGINYQVFGAEDGASALAVASSTQPDLVMMDVMMPGIDGFTLAQRIRQLPGLGKVPLIFLTARTASTDMIKGIQLGAKHYLTKPFEIKDILAKVSKILGEPPKT